jgi:hypothetical protein
VRNEGADRRDAGGNLTAQQTLDGRRRSLKGNVEVLKVRSPGHTSRLSCKRAGKTS